MVTFIPTPIGNIGDITYRAVEILSQIDLIFCEDTRVTKSLLKLLQERLNINLPDFKLVSFNEHNATKRLNEFEDNIRVLNCAYMSDAGMPAISDPGAELVRFCQENNINYDFLPGASVAPLVYAASGFESGKFYFYGFLPNKGKKRSEELNRVMNSGIDAIIYEAPHRIIKLLKEIHKLDSKRRVFIAKELTKKFQKYLFGDIDTVLKSVSLISSKGEWALVIEGRRADNLSVDISDILSLDLSPKIKAKLISKITKKSVKECYEELTKKSY